MYSIVFFFFFFQAEDGIRDLTVTGVQTCALPICVVTLNIGTVEGAWKFLLAIGAGTGLVYLLRWYWWRVNAWSEVSAMIAAFVLSMGLQWGAGLDPDRPRSFAFLMLLTVAGTTAIWLLVTHLTPAEPMEHLK